jgi:Ca2+-binding RTX toxin-like protein
VRPTTIAAALTTTLAASLAMAAPPAGAAVTSASIDGGTATLNLDGADDNVTVSVSGGLLVHGQTTGGLNSGADWNSAAPGDQTVPADGSFGVDVNGGDGNDSITVIAKSTEIGGVKLNGDGGDDVLTGADSGDALHGGDGNDRLVGGKGGDDMDGGAGNDTLVWNNGDGSDFADGGAGNDTTEVNGSPTLGDDFVVEPNGGLVKFRRTNLVGFTIEASTERFQVNGLGGDDFLSAQAGTALPALTQLSVDGGPGNDTLDGSDGADLILGGEGNDVLDGRGGDDRIVGDRGNDTMNGEAGDDTLVWNNGDASDVVNGGDGRDDVEVNGAPAAGDVFTVARNGARIAFARGNLVPFSIDVGSSESLHANGLGGDDAVTVGDVGGFAVTASGGSGNDTLTGGPSADTLLGGSGNDTIVAGGGIDVVSGDDGDDHVDVRDRTADLARGGDGRDTAIADQGNRDVLDGFEIVDRTPNATPPPVVTPPPVHIAPLPVRIGGGTVKVRMGRAKLRVSAPAAARGDSVGSLTLRTARPVHVGGRRAVLRLGSARFDLAPGASATVRVRLPRGTARLAGRHGRLAAVASASTGSARSARRLTLLLPAQR